MPPKRLILITGMTGSGKTTLAGLFEGYGYRVLTMGDVIRDLAKERGLDPTPSNIGVLAEEIRQKGGVAAVAEICVEKLRKMDDNNMVVDGIRSMAEVEVFRDVYDAVLVAVHASPRTRHCRIKVRKRKDDPLDQEAFVRRDERELGFNLGRSMALADHMIVNEGTLEDLKWAFEGLIARLGCK